MIKLSTSVSACPLEARISLEDKIMVLGSCFADSMGSRLADGGFDVCVNPFGTLYNPVSICNSIARLESGQPFRDADCVEMGAGAGLICSFSHHSSFARATAEEFLSNANASLSEASAFWKSCNKVIISLGTAMVWKRVKAIVSLLLKDLEGRMAARGLKLAVTDAARDEIIREGSDPLFGARPLKRFIQSKVESLLARHIIANSPKEGSTLTVDADQDQLIVK